MSDQKPWYVTRTYLPTLIFTYPGTSIISYLPTYLSTYLPTHLPTNLPAYFPTQVTKRIIGLLLRRCKFSIIFLLSSHFPRSLIVDL